MVQPFSLRPFAEVVPPVGWVIDGQLDRTGDLLSLRYRLRGPLCRLQVPIVAATPQRRHQLWQATCFEVFLAPSDSPVYWEANLSPAGHWNLYRFSSYRHGMRQEEAISAPAIGVTRRPRLLQLDATLDLAPLQLADKPLKIGISAVLADTDASLSYWALHHPVERPDFHQRSAFSLLLPPS